MTLPFGRTVSLVALALALAGCGGTEPTAGGPAAASATVTTAPATSAPAVSAKPSTQPCQQTKAWSETQTVNWVRAMSGTDGYDVVLGRNSDALDLCKAMPVQVEFWRVDLRSFAGNASFQLKSVQRKQVSVDGRRTVTVRAPKGFAVGECTGTLTAVYVGKPLAEGDLPARLDPAGAAGAAVEFPAPRVAFSSAGMPGTSGDLRRCRAL